MSGSVAARATLDTGPARHEGTRTHVGQAQCYAPIAARAPKQQHARGICTESPQDSMAPTLPVLRSDDTPTEKFWKPKTAELANPPLLMAAVKAC